MSKIGRPISNVDKIREDYGRLVNNDKYMRFIINDAAIFFDDNEYMNKEQLWQIINKWKKYIIDEKEQGVS